MEDLPLENQNYARRVSLEAQRAAMMDALNLHVKRSEDLAAVIAQIDRDLDQLGPEVPT
jgi:type II secretory pathway component PulJ